MVIGCSFVFSFFTFGHGDSGSFFWRSELWILTCDESIRMDSSALICKMLLIFVFYRCHLQKPRTLSASLVRRVFVLERWWQFSGLEVVVFQPGLVMRINFRIRIAFAKFFKVIASIDRIFAFAWQIRVFAFSHRCFMAIFSGQLQFRTIWLNSVQFFSVIMKSNWAQE